MSIHVVDGAAEERAKYSEIWSLDEYREADSPGVINVERFMSVLKPDLQRQPSLYDIGCGSGKAGLAFEKHGLRVSYVDITDAGLDPAVDRKNFVMAPLWDRWAQERHMYGFCCDVLEHIPPEYVMLVISRILDACDTVWFQIANRPDKFGALIGEQLHLTVQPYSWWLVRMGSLGKVIDARDLCGDSLFVVEGAR